MKFHGCLMYIHKEATYMLPLKSNVVLVTHIRNLQIAK